MELYFDNSLSIGYKSHSQIARRLTEDWVERNMFCPICGNPVLTHYENNRPVADFYCEHCHSDFELKSKECNNGILGKKINDGAYDTMISRIKSYNNPNFFFMNYADGAVNNLWLIPNHFSSPPSSRSASLCRRMPKGLDGRGAASCSTTSPKAARLRLSETR